MAQLSGMGNSSAAMMMPYLGDITSKKVGSDTVYTLTLNSKAYKGLMDDVISMVTSIMGEDLGIALDMDLSECAYVYTIDSKGCLKNMAATAKMSMDMDMSVGNETVSMTASIDVAMDMKVNAVGKDVKVSYPDLSKFQDMESILVIPDSSAYNGVSPFAA